MKKVINQLIIILIMIKLLQNINFKIYSNKINKDLNIIFMQNKMEKLFQIGHWTRKLY